MKILIGQNTSILYLTTENAHDHYLVGRLAAKLKSKASVFSKSEGQREMQVDADDFIALAAE